jgi:hypothetical protein
VSYGYPAADRRWPEYQYSGEDLISCSGRDTYDTKTPGTMWMACTMTGRSSGGPWIVGGRVTSVNSHKPHGGRWMSGPYFDAAEAQLFQDWRSRQSPWCVVIRSLLLLVGGPCRVAHRCACHGGLPARPPGP